jgi:hypothetical protein
MSPEDPDTAAVTGTVAWTAEGRKAMREKSGLFHGIISEQEIAGRFGVSLGVVRKLARAKGIGRKLGRTRWLTEAETLALMEEEDTCSSSQSAMAQTSTPAGRSSKSQLKEALELATEGKRKSSSPSCIVKSSRGTSVVPFPPRKGSRGPR